MASGGVGAATGTGVRREAAFGAHARAGGLDAANWAQQSQ